MIKDLSSNLSSLDPFTHTVASSGVTSGTSASSLRVNSQKVNLTKEDLQPSMMKQDMICNDRYKPLSFSISRLLTSSQGLEKASEHIKSKLLSPSDQQRESNSGDFCLKSAAQPIDHHHNHHHQAGHNQSGSPLKSLQCQDSMKASEMNFFNESRCDLIPNHPPQPAPPHPCVQQYPFPYQWLKRPSPLPPSYPMPRSSLFPPSHDNVPVGYPLTLAWMSSFRGSPIAPFMFFNRKPKRVRTAFSPSQLMELEKAFDKNNYVIGNERKELAKKLGLNETQVKVWFQNRRTKQKRQKQEEDDGTYQVSNSDNRGDADMDSECMSDVDDDEDGEVMMSRSTPSSELSQYHHLNHHHHHHHLTNNSSSNGNSNNNNNNNINNDNISINNSSSSNSATTNTTTNLNNRLPSCESPSSPKPVSQLQQPHR